MELLKDTYEFGGITYLVWNTFEVEVVFWYDKIMKYQ